MNYFAWAIDHLTTLGVILIAIGCYLATSRGDR